jgi:HK97 family phage portal protein
MITVPQIYQRIKNAGLALLSDPGRYRILLIPSRHAQVHVDHDTAMKYSAFYRGVAYISQSIAGLPWETLRQSPDKTERLTRHSLWYTLRVRANPEMSAFSFKETLIAHAITHGNGFAEIEFDEAGRPLYFWPITPDRVQVKRDPETNQIYYEIANFTAPPTILPPWKMFHLHGLGFDGLTGYSLITLAGRSLGLSIAAEMYGEDFFSNGAVSTGYLQHPKSLGDEAYNRLKDQMNEKAMFGRKWRPMVLEEGMKWESIALNARDSQMLETRQFQISDIARWLGLPPHKLADLTRSTYSNIESQSIEVVNDAFMPWIYRLEQEANYKLFTGRERGVITKMNVRGLLRGDDMSRAAYYQIMRNIGVYSTNDIRRLEDMDPVGSEGDELLVQLNQTTLKRLVSGEPNKQKPATPPPQVPGAPAPPDPDQMKQNYAGLVLDAFRRILKREKGRFDQVRHKEPADLAAWRDGFLPEHRNYMIQTLRPVFYSLAAMLDPAASVLDAQTTNILEAATTAHIVESRRTLENLTTDPNGEFEIEARAKREADDLLERFVVAIVQRRTQ